MRIDIARRSAALFAAALALSSCTESAKPDASASGKIAVKTVVVKEELITPEINTFGSLSFLRKADITATVEGKISELKADEGKKVRKGETLAILANVQLSIKAIQAQSTLAQAKAALEQAQTRYKEGKLQVEAQLISLEKSELQLKQKEKELELMAQTIKDKRELFAIGGVTKESMNSMELEFDSNLVSLEGAKKDLSMQKIGYRDEDIRSYGLSVPSDPEKKQAALIDVNTRSFLAELHVAEAQLQSARTELESINQLLSELTLTSPLDGIVGARYLERGEKVQADAKVFTVFDAEEVDVVFNVPESTGMQLREGMDISVIIDTLGKQPVSAKIRQVSPIVDAQTGNVSIKALIKGKDKRLKPGMFARVRVVYGQPANSILIPSTAIFKKQDDRAVVFVVVSGRAFQKEIKLGETKQDRIIALEGLKANDAVIDSPSPIIREGDEVDAQK